MEILGNNTNKRENNIISSTINLIDRKNLKITGVEKILESNDRKLQLVVAKSNLTIIGEDLNVSVFDVEAGKIEAEGLINEIKFYEQGKKENLFKKMFK